MSETTEIKKSKISELPEQTSPTTSANLVGVDNGETVQIPMNFFQELIDGKLPYLNILWNSPTDTISIILDALVEADLLLASYKPVVRLYGYGSALLLCSGGKGADGRVNLYATNLYDGKVVQSIGVYPTTVTISDFLAQESISTYQEQINELKEAVEGKAESDHGHSYNDLTDKPTIPSVEGLASETYVDGKVAGIVNSAPETLDTLNELSKALGNDPNFAASVATQIGNKVDKVSGKGLSTNDYTTAEKNKLAGLSTVATSGSYNDLKDKPSIPSAYNHPTYTAKANGLYKVTVDATGHVSGATAVSKSDITALGIPAQDTTYSHPASHPASMITGLAKVATSGSYNDLTDKPTIPSIAGLATEKYVDEKISSLPSGGGSSSGGGGIVTVETLPTEGVADTIYKVYELGKIGIVEHFDNPSTPIVTYAEIVDELPEVGKPFIDISAGEMNPYFLKPDNAFYGYITDEIAPEFGLSTTGWTNLADITPIVIVYSPDELDYSKWESGECMYAIATKKPHLYIYEGEWLEIPIGFRLVFNSADSSLTIVES